MVIFDHVKHKMLLVTVAAEDPQAKLDEVYELLRQPLAAEWTAPRASKRKAQFTHEFPESITRPRSSRRRNTSDRRHLPGRPLPARVRGDQRRPVPGLPRAADPEPVALHVLPRLRRVPARGLVAEIHAKLDGRQAVIRPIAAPAGRGKTPEEDAALEKELLADEKERAEHLMLIDLARNDVGRCADYGSVHCTDLYTIEKYSHVMHIVSEVVGKLTAGQDQFDLPLEDLPRRHPDRALPRSGR
jgi:hypothetical protein